MDEVEDFFDDYTYTIPEKKLKGVKAKHQQKSVDPIQYMIHGGLRGSKTKNGRKKKKG